MNARKPPLLRPEPPPTVMEAIRERLAGRDMQALEVLFAVRSTARQMDNCITEWMADTAASPARFQIMILLWAARGHGVPHKEIVAALGVTRATVSGLMAALESDGLVKSSAGREDRRSLLATLTSRGKAVIERAIETDTVRLRAAFADLSSKELETFRELLQRVRRGFSASANGNKKKGRDLRRSR
jgi:DNA-binding MarR family transcriptional regulator